MLTLGLNDSRHMSRDTCSTNLTLIKQTVCVVKKPTLACTIDTVAHPTMDSMAYKTEISTKSKLLQGQLTVVIYVIKQLLKAYELMFTLILFCAFIYIHSED